VWSCEHSAVASAPPDAVWRLYADAAGWPAWNGAVERLEIDGPFAAGTTGRLTPPGQTPLKFRLVAAEPGAGYTSETEIAETVTLRTTSRLGALSGGRTRITHRVELTGPAAEFFGQSFGSALSAGVPAAVEALARRAAGAPAGQVAT
jgi:uncharacterized protein YndB with AHSA1/START domain